ncbi:M20/M25/M40 family metallo-hydrolase [Olivibacter ginsenosidimutans]|uniref:M20/M25/M40 family metallo-hydrolase n=1 Tax=Olivibacter ginsenosidimutans TaxID=1176537 RepID=A0ABP9AZG7_9SPHI
MDMLFKKLPLLIVLFCVSCCASVKEQRGAQNESQVLKDVKTLSSTEFEGRRTGTAGAEKARKFIIERFKNLDLQSFPSFTDYIQSFTLSEKSDSSHIGENVIAYIPGKIKEAIVLSAHYDHLGKKGSQLYPGADDNASGVAALLEFAQYFAKNKPNFTLIFAAFDAEEMGLKGAKAFVADPPLALERIKLNINMDMIAHNDTGELYACGTYYYPQLKKYINSNQSSLKILLGHDNPSMGHDDWTNQSDQGAFHAKKIPFLYFGVEDHKDYHQPTDTYENINQTFYVQAVDGILEIIKTIDSKLSSQIQIDKNKVMF